MHEILLRCSGLADTMRTGRRPCRDVSRGTTEMATAGLSVARSVALRQIDSESRLNRLLFISTVCVLFQSIYVAQKKCWR